MSTLPRACWICLSPAPPDAEDARYHPACLLTFFGSPSLPARSFDRQAVIAWSGEHAGTMSISGYQPKAPASLSEDSTKIVLVEKGGGYIIKPQHGHFRFTPENEHLTMRLGHLAGLRVADSGLIELADRSLAYITKRFDRVGEDHARLHQEDFCQLAGLDPEDKDKSSAEECAFIARSHAGARGASDLFQLFVFSYWVRNGDLHLKNIALLEDRDSGGHELAPAYDLLCTWLYNNTGMMLPVGGERKNISRRQWLDFAETACGLDRRDAAAVVDRMIGHLPQARAMIERSALPTADAKRRYTKLLEKRTRSLSPGR